MTGDRSVGVCDCACLIPTGQVSVSQRPRVPFQSLLDERLVCPWLPKMTLPWKQLLLLSIIGYLAGKPPFYMSNDSFTLDIYCCPVIAEESKMMSVSETIGGPRFRGARLRRSCRRPSSFLCEIFVEILPFDAFARLRCGECM